MAGITAASSINPYALQMNSSTGPEISSRIQPMIHQLLANSVTELELYNKGLTDTEIKAIAWALKQNTSLTTLNLHNNNISDEGVDALVQALKQNTTLKTLNLANTKISTKGIETLAEMLKENKSLTTLDLSFNGIQDEKLEVLAEGLKQNKFLITLNLSSNHEISDKGVRTLLEVLKQNTSLKTLNLSNNSGIGDAGAKVIAEALPYLLLVNLELENSWIGDEGAKALALALPKNRFLKKLDLFVFRLPLGAPKIGDEGLRAFTQVFKAAVEENGFLHLEELILNFEDISDSEENDLFAAITKNNEQKLIDCNLVSRLLSYA